MRVQGSRSDNNQVPMLRSVKHTRHRRQRCRPNQRKSRQWKVITLGILVAANVSGNVVQGFEGNRGHRPNRNLDDDAFHGGAENHRNRGKGKEASSLFTSALSTESFTTPRRTLRILRRRVVRRSFNIVEGVRTKCGSLFHSSRRCSLDDSGSSGKIRGGATSPSKHPPSSILDRLARSCVLLLGWVVSFQTLGSVVRLYKDCFLEVCFLIPALSTMSLTLPN